MTNRKAKILFLGFIVIIIGIATRKYFFKSWSPYYQEKLYKAPRPLLMQVMEFFKNSADQKLALELGAGAGNETAYLLNHGWKVWANDAEQEAIKIIKARTDVQGHFSNLVLMPQRFSDLPWSNLPKFNLIYAGYSLPFARESEFRLIWQHVTHALKSGGIFAGNFFAPDHSTFNWWVRRGMTFLNKEQLLKFLEGFHIELFEETHKEDYDGSVVHIFNVIAKKL